jgi:hypothetical protein
MYRKFDMTKNLFFYIVHFSMNLNTNLERYCTVTTRHFLCHVSDVVFVMLKHSSGRSLYSCHFQFHFDRIRMYGSCNDQLEFFT